MTTLLLGVSLLLVTVIIVAIGDRIGLPWPVLLTLVAAGTLFIPGLPDFYLPADLMLPIFLPPLLWALARRTSWGMIRLQWRTVLGLSVALVFATVFAVAGVAWWYMPGLGIAGAVLLGAAVAPPDPVAVDAVAEPAGVPRRILNTLQTEGLFNDAASIVAFHVALGAITAGKNPSIALGALSFFYSAAVATVLGLVFGFASAKLTDWIALPVVRNAFTWVIPFAVYLAAEEIHASGVIAIVIAAITMHSRARIGAEDRLTGRAFWETVELLFTGVAFGLIGLSVRQSVQEAAGFIGHAIIGGVLISLTMFAVRFIWMYFTWKLYARTGRRDVAPLRLQEVLLLTMSGMRGMVTLALILSIPSGLVAYENEFGIIALVVLTCTMVIPGLSLPWMMSKLSLDRGPDAKGDEARAALNLRAKKAALAVVNGYTEHLPDEMIDNLKYWVAEQTGFAATPEARDKAFEEARSKVVRIRRQAMLAAQAEILSARREPGTDPSIADEVLRSIDRMILATKRDTAH